MSKNSSTKIGLIGAGYWGKNYLRVFNELGVLKTFCDLNKELVEQRKKEYLGVLATSDHSDILNDKEIGAVVIATPALTHYELTKRALEAGKNVLVEKPLAMKVEQGEELVALAKEKNRILMVGHLLHYHPAIIKLKEMIKNGDLGEIRYVWSSRLNFGKLRREENVLWSFAPHDISLIIDILGMPRELTAVGKSYLQENVPDTTLSILSFSGNQTAHIFVSWLNPFKEHKLSVIGSEKMAVFDGVKNELMVYPHQVKWREDNSFEAIRAKGQLIDFLKKEPLTEEAKHFVQCLKEKKKPKTDGKEALSVLKILTACQNSLEENGKSIEI